MAGIVYPQHRLVKDRFKAALHFRVQTLIVAGNVAVAITGGCFDQAKLPDIPGDGSLRDSKALFSQVLQQYLLPADGMLLNQPQNRLLTLGFPFGVSGSGSVHTQSLFRYRLLRSFWSMAWNWSAFPNVMSCTIWLDRRISAVAPARIG